VAFTERVPQQKNGYDCGAFTCIFCLDFNQTAIALTILNDTTDTHSDNVSQSCSVVQGSMVQTHQDIISSTTFGDEFHVAKLNEKLCEEIFEVLKFFVDNQFPQKGLEDQEFKFKYYHTRSDENTELEVNAISVAKGLLARLKSKDSNPQKTPRNKLIPYIKHFAGDDLNMSSTGVRAYPLILSKYCVCSLVCVCVCLSTTNYVGVCSIVINRLHFL
jgi:hypothetical protein